MWHLLGVVGENHLEKKERQDNVEKICSSAAREEMRTGVRVCASMSAVPRIDSSERASLMVKLVILARYCLVIITKSKSR